MNIKKDVYKSKKRRRSSMQYDLPLHKHTLNSHMAARLRHPESEHIRLAAIGDWS